MEDNIRTNVKKRLMFLKGEDLYFLTYNILILLHVLSCDNEDKPFIDYTKLAFLIDFVADGRLVNALENKNKYESMLRNGDVRVLQSSYTEGLTRKHIVSRLVFALEKRNIVHLALIPARNTIAIWLNQSVMPNTFYKSEYFGSELENALKITRALPRLRTMSLDTTIERIYTNNGVSTWRV